MTGMTDVLRTLTHEQASGYIGDAFQIRFDDGTTVDLRLEEVQLLTEKHVNPMMKRDAFALHFRGPREIQLKQATYPVYHEQLGGPLYVFLVPIGVNATGFEYEAVFN